MNISGLKDLIDIAEKLKCGETATRPIYMNKNRKVIVRSKDAGVIYGDYVSNDSSTITLNSAIQMWQWFAAKGISLIDVATYGVVKSKCKFSTSKASIVIFNACALIDVTNEAAETIESL